MKVDTSVWNILKVFVLSNILTSCPETKGGNLLADRFEFFFLNGDSKEAAKVYDEEEEKAFWNKYDFDRISKLCPKTSCFASYNPNHRRAVMSLTRGYLEQTTDSEFKDFSMHLEPIHPRVWYHSLIRSQYLRKSPDFYVPSPIELFPTAVIPALIIRPHLAEQACMFLDGRFGSDNGEENRLWYFREDLQVNVHHLMWHLLYPWNSTYPASRRGELFYFFHHDILARYSAERLSNDLEPTAPLDLQWGAELEQGYRSHLTDGISTLKWANRQPRETLSNETLNAAMVDYFFKFTDKRHHVVRSVNRGTLKGNDSMYSIKRYDYINLLGELSEASNQTFNAHYYGEDGYHDDGHWIMANVDVNLYGDNPNDPVGIIADSLTAMRDPLFYRWHQYVDNVFQKYKVAHLEPYKLHEGDFPLVFKGVKISNVKVVADTSSTTPGRINHLETFWSIQKFDLRGRLDTEGGNLYENATDTADVCAKHLNHQEFIYEISIENSLTKPTPATVRIFMAPRFKSQKQNKHTRYKMFEQRSLFFTMDQFKTVLTPGRNLFGRRSLDSSLTTPWPLSFKEIKRIKEGHMRTQSDTSQRAAYDCGFPHHLLLPKGNEIGMIFDLFVMVTDGNEDKVQGESSESYDDKYRPTPIHCGSPGREYPDNKPMGYPFDRRPRTTSHPVKLPTGQHIFENREVDTLEEYVNQIPNMFISQIVIQHRNYISGLENFVEIYAKENDENNKHLYNELNKLTMRPRN